MAIYREGMTDPYVGQIQQKLKTAGFDPGEIDNIYGPKTAGAVKAFQSAAGITADAIYGPQTEAALLSYKPGTQETQPTAPVTSPATGGVPPTTGQIPPTIPPTTPSTISPTIPEYKAPEIAPYESSLQIKSVLDELATQEPYESPYAASLQKVVDSFVNREFEYDPATDTEFQQASKELSRNVMELMNARGILSSTITENQIQQGIADLLPKYRALAYDKFQDEGTQLIQKANMLMNVDEMNYSRFQDNRETRYKMLDYTMKLDEREFELYKDSREQQYKRAKDEYSAALDKYDMQQKAITSAWDRVDEMGYVDNNAAIAIGVAPGTLSRGAREDKEEREFKIEQEKTEFTNRLKELEAVNNFNIKLDDARTRNKLRTEQDKIKAEQITPEQYANYNDIITGLTKMEPNEALRHVERLGKKLYTDLIGENLYNQLIDDLQKIATTPEEVVDTATIEKTVLGLMNDERYSEAIGFILGRGLDETEEIRLINLYGLDQYMGGE